MSAESFRYACVIQFPGIPRQTPDGGGGALLSGLSCSGGWLVSGVLVGVDNPRGRMVFSVQCFGEKRLAATVSRSAERSQELTVTRDGLLLPSQK